MEIYEDIMCVHVQQTLVGHAKKYLETTQIRCKTSLRVRPLSLQRNVAPPKKRTHTSCTWKFLVLSILGYIFIMGYIYIILKMVLHKHHHSIYGKVHANYHLMSTIRVSYTGYSNPTMNDAWHNPQGSRQKATLDPSESWCRRLRGCRDGDDVYI